MLAGLIHRWINAYKTHKGTAAGEAAHITDLCHQLWSGSAALQVSKGNETSATNAASRNLSEYA